MTKTKAEPVPLEASEEEEQPDPWRHRVNELAVECEQAREKWLLAKEYASGLKKDYEAKLEKLLGLAKLEIGRELPLFAGETGQEDQDWRETPLAEAKREILAEAELTTLGELEDFRKAKGEGPWDLKGIGPSARMEIEEQVVTWFERWRKRRDKAQLDQARREMEGDEE
jgi:hypothetical protein